MTSEWSARDAEEKRNMAKIRKPKRRYRVMITGTRNPGTQSMVDDAIRALCLKHGAENLIIFHGDATGTDLWVKLFSNRYEVEHREFKADWDQFGLKAGPIRNMKMINNDPDLVIAFPIGVSKGTRGAMKEAAKRGIPVLNWVEAVERRARL